MVSFAIFIVCWLLKLSKAHRQIVKSSQSNRQILEGFDRKLGDIATRYDAQPKVLEDSISYLRSVADDMRWQVTNKDISLADQLDTLTRQCHNLSHQQVEVTRCISHLSSAIFSSGPREPIFLDQEHANSAAGDKLGALPTGERHNPEIHRPGLRPAPVKSLHVAPAPQSRMERHFETQPSRKVVTLGDHLARQAN
jgi:hypothetical protein